MSKENRERQIEQFPDGTTITWWADGRVDVEFPYPTFPVAERARYTAYVDEVIVARAEMESL